MDFMDFCEAMENKIVLREVRRLFQTQQCRLRITEITDWVIDKNIKRFEFRVLIDGLASIEDENIELLEKYVDARYEMFMRHGGTVRLL